MMLMLPRRAVRTDWRLGEALASPKGADSGGSSSKAAASSLARVKSEKRSLYTAVTSLLFFVRDTISSPACRALKRGRSVWLPMI